MDSLSKKNLSLRILVVTITLNVALSAYKMIAGVLDNSSALVSDAIHSLSDVATSIIVIIGVIIAAKPKDNLHQYGHERFESVAAIILSALLFITGLYESYNGLHELISGAYLSAPLPSYLALSAAAVSIVVKEGMFWYVYIPAKKMNSISLKADAWHHRSDALSSVGSLAGVGFTMIFGLPILDTLAALIICIFIFKVAVGIFVDAIDKLVDKSCPEEYVDKIKNVIANVEGVLSVDEVKTRVFGDKIYVDIEIGAYKNLTLEQAHDVAERAHRAVEGYDDKIKHCMVHVNPVDTDKLRDNVDLSVE